MSIMTDNIKGEIHNRNFDIFQERKYNTANRWRKEGTKMAKKKKQRKVDFTKEEIMDMSQRGSVQDLDYRLKKMKSYYGLDN